MAAPLIAAAVAAPIIAGAFGAANASSDRAEAKDQINMAVQELRMVGVPHVEAMKLSMDYLKSVGKLTPEYEQAFQQVDSEMKGIELDPRTEEAQYRALNELSSIGDEGGLRLSDKASMEEAMTAAGVKERGAREAIDSSLKARGAYGSGAELASKLSATQDASTTGHLVGLNAAGKAQDRALQAIIAAGQLGGGMQANEFGRARAIAEAQDEINRFNTANSIGAGQRNIDRSNTAQQYNLANDQRISDANVGLKNEAEAYNKNLLQRNFDNQLNRATAVANARTGSATQLNNSANQTAGMWSGIGQGVGQGAAAIYTAQQKPQGIAAGEPNGGVYTDELRKRKTDNMIA